MALYKFGEIAFNSTEKKKPVESDKSVYIGLEHLDSGDLRVNRWGSDVAPIGDKLIMKKGDVLFGKRRAYQKKVAIAPFDGIFSAHGLILRPKEDAIDKEFFPFFISSDYFLDKAIKISVGSLSPTINWGDLKELEFDLPAMEEQKRLAKILMAAEETRQAYKKLIKQTDDLVKAKFEEMFDKDMSFHPRKLSELCSLITKGTTPTTYGFNFEDSGINFIKIENITENNEILYADLMHISDKCNSFMSRSQLKEGDILFSIAGAIGRIALIDSRVLPANTNQALAIIRIKEKEEINRRFLIQVLKSHYVQKQLYKQKQGIAQINLSLQNISDLQVVIPPLELQNQFVNFADNVEQIKMVTQQSLDALNETVRALVNRNFN